MCVKFWMFSFSWWYVENLLAYSSGSQPFLMHSSLGSFWNFSFLPYYTNSTGWLKRFKRHFCDDSDRTL